MPWICYRLKPVHFPIRTSIIMTVSLMLSFKNFTFAFALTTILIPSMAFPHTLSIDQPLPAVTVEEVGELTMNGKDMGHHNGSFS